jgi:hypothetical protein
LENLQHLQRGNARNSLKWLKPGLSWPRKLAPAAAKPQNAGQPPSTSSFSRPRPRGFGRASGYGEAGSMPGQIAAAMDEPVRSKRGAMSCRWGEVRDGAVGVGRERVALGGARPLPPSPKRPVLAEAGTPGSISGDFVPIRTIETDRTAAHPPIPTVPACQCHGRVGPILLQKSALNEGQLPGTFFRASGAWPPVQVRGVTSRGRYA